MKVNRIASVPLVLHDPFFSIWSAADHLYDQDTVHWTGIRQKIRGHLTIDGKVYTFMGDPEFHQVIPQKSLEVTATATEYIFENEAAELKVRFTSPLLPDDMVLVSRPCTYVDFTLEQKLPGEAMLDVEVSADLVRREKSSPVIGIAGNKQNPLTKKAYVYGSIGRAKQQPLGNSGDLVTIDWGYAYVASENEAAKVRYDASNEALCLSVDLSEQKSTGVILAYDDLLSINYFGQWRKAYWTGTYSTIFAAIEAAFADQKEVLARAAALDADIEAKARNIGGEAYAYLCNVSFRQAFAAHKLIKDEEGNVIFLSKENASNGCIGTVDVSYPSTPLFLLYDTEYVKGMLRPVFRFAACDVWEYDFAPHDVGRYPYAWGQVYGVDRAKRGINFTGEDSAVYPPFYQYPAGSDVYALTGQMPVEECGNMLVMTAAVCLQDGSAEFARPYWETLKQWNRYLLAYGEDPGEQLCTDDFAGHLSHNVNLAAKAIMGVEAYAKLAGMLGYEEEAAIQHENARKMAKSWEERALADDHYALCFGSPETWSLKYNLVWDKIWGCGLFSEAVYEKELAYYLKKTNQYGVPLDNRSDYTKSDWILWCAAMAKDRETAQQLISPVAAFLEQTPDRKPFSDWYFTSTGTWRGFIARSVQGGIFMPMLRR